MRKLLGRVDDGRFGRAVAGLQADWQWVVDERGEGQQVRGMCVMVIRSMWWLLSRGGAGRGGVRTRIRWCAGYCASTWPSRCCRSWGWPQRRAAHTGSWFRRSGAFFGRGTRPRLRERCAAQGMVAAAGPGLNREGIYLDHAHTWVTSFGGYALGSVTQECARWR